MQMNSFLHVSLSLLLITLLSGCFNSSDNETNSNIFEAPQIENLPEITEEAFVTISLRTRPNADIYLNKVKVATSDSKGTALISLPMQANKESSSFELSVRDGDAYSETLYFSIHKKALDIEEMSSSSSLHVSSSSAQSSSTVVLSSASSIADDTQVSSLSSAIVVLASSSSSSEANSLSSATSSIIVALSSSSSSSSSEIASQASSSSESISQILQIRLSQTSLELAEGNTTALHVNANYDDNSTQTLTSNLQWVITDPEIITIANGTLQALKEGETTLKARYQNLTSQSLHVKVYRAINGHRLPPIPDEDINDNTLLGIDFNNNGVRDDMEIWIFETYKHPIVQAVAMQNARAFQIILVEPEKARETTEFMENASDCNAFYRLYADDHNETILIPKRKSLYKESRPIMLNTRERSRAYYEYNQALSGGVYALRPIETLKSKCDFNATKVLRGEW
jgi:hypothetical protein